ncbi:MAG TPA: OmpA family protein [Saprospiraceae bacterium]|nr:OmpA family protein [Saprospiraceae bacterium]
MKAQEVISLENPSFEDMPRAGTSNTPSIKGWHDCGLTKFPGETPPDIHPVPSSAWEVSKPAFDGETYLGMVVRYNDTYESLSQALSSPVEGGVCYSFSAFLSRSDQYKSGTTRSNSVLENFVRPAVFQIWGGNSFCDKAELLGESPAIANSDWKLFKFLFHPQQTHRYITIEAFYKTPILEAYNGHVLVDGLSEMVPVDCPLVPTDVIAVMYELPSKMEPAISSGGSHSSSSSRTKTGGGSSSNTDPKTVTTPPKVFKANLLPELDQSKLFVGQKIRLTHLYFKADSINLLSNSYKVLDELADYLSSYPKTTIEIGGHTNTIPSEEYCNALSTARAKSVQEYLITQGIMESRLKYKGYGKHDPLIPYDKYNKDARLKNQRVEIKILSLK